MRIKGSSTNKTTLGTDRKWSQ